MADGGADAGEVVEGFEDDDEDEGKDKDGDEFGPLVAFVRHLI